MNEYSLIEWRIALRSLIRCPRLVFIFVITLAISLITMIIFLSINTSVFAKEIAFKDANKQYIVTFQTEFYGKNIVTNSLLQRLYMSNKTDVDEIALYVRETSSLKLPKHTVELETAFVSDSYFAQLGLLFKHGKGFKEYKKLANSAFLPSPIVLTDQFWREQFSGNSDIIGQQVMIGDRPFKIIGILKAGMNPPKSLGFKKPQIYKSLSYANENLQVPHNDFALIAKVQANHIDLYTNAEEQLANKLKESIVSHPPLRELPIKVNVLPLKESISVYNEKSSWPWLLSAFLLPLACCNLCTLLLIRNFASQRSFALYTAIGARRRHIFNMLLRQNILLLFVSYIVIVWAIELTQFTTSEPFSTSNALLNSYLLIFTAIVCGIIALILTGVNYYFAAKNNTDLVINSSVIKMNFNQHAKLFSITVLSQSILILILLSFSMLFVKKVLDDLMLLMAINGKNKAIAYIDTNNKYLTKDMLSYSLSKMAKKISDLPNVSHVALRGSLPITNITVRKSANSSEVSLQMNEVQASYFNEMGIEFIASSTFSESDQIKPYEVILDQRAANQLLGENWSIGDSMRVKNSAHKLIGVIKNTSIGLNYFTKLSENSIFLPLDNSISNSSSIYQVALDISYQGIFYTFIDHVMTIETQPDESLSFVSFTGLENNLEKNINKAEKSLILAILLCLYICFISVMSIQNIVKLKLNIDSNTISYQIALGARPLFLFKKYVIEILKPWLFGVVIGVGFTMLITQSNIIYTNLFSSLTLFYLTSVVITAVFILLITILIAVFNGINNQSLSALKLALR